MKKIYSILLISVLAFGQNVFAQSAYIPNDNLLHSYFGKLLEDVNKFNKNKLDDSELFSIINIRQSLNPLEEGYNFYICDSNGIKINQDDQYYPKGYSKRRKKQIIKDNCVYFWDTITFTYNDVEIVATVHENPYPEKDKNGNNLFPYKIWYKLKSSYDN